MTLGNAQSCQTPCNLRVPAGRQYISVAGPGSKYFRTAISIPDSPSQVVVQHFTLGKVAAGITLLVTGIPGLIAGAILTSRELSNPDGSTAVAAGYGSMATAGGGAIVSAVGALATLKLNRGTRWARWKRRRGSVCWPPESALPSIAPAP